MTSLAADSAGRVWAGTTGGLLYRPPDGSWRKLTRRDGMPSHEVLAVVHDGKDVLISFPTADARLTGGRWVITKTPPKPPVVPVREVTWRSRRVGFIAEGLRIQGRRTVESYPPHKGSHISAVLPRPQELWVAFYGDGAWIYARKRWQRAPRLPVAANQITCMAEGKGRVWAGTRRHGLWEFDGTKWSNHLYPDEPYQHNIQALWAYGGRVWGSTLEDGLVSYEDGVWSSVQAPVISSNAPRQGVTVGGVAYLRHGGGAADLLRGTVWQKDALRQHLPRKEAYILAADQRKLYVGQHGGWSELEGGEWRHFFQIENFGPTPVTALEPLENGLAIGTQGRGLGLFSYSTGSLQWQDERAGLTDDWVTALLRVGETLYAGTFVGGLMIKERGGEWRPTLGLTGENVTSIASLQDRIYVGTRRGLFRLGGNRVSSVNRHVPWLDTEVQALLATRGGLWVATRTGLFHITASLLSTQLTH